MKVSDYIVEFLIKKGITDVFGYPGGMVTHLMDSFEKYKKQIQVHISFHEQAAAFEACAYAQVSGGVGVAYATSGPGATNMITGICHAYFDSVPMIFITGQVNTFESKEGFKIRQRGFQETNIVSMVKEVTKYSVYVENEHKIKNLLEKAYSIAVSGRKGPVLLDIPMDVQRAELSFSKEENKVNKVNVEEIECDYSVIIDIIRQSKMPCMILGAALKGMSRERISRFVKQMNMPVVTSMIAIDLLTYDEPFNYGFIGSYGARAANFIVAKSDLILALGSRLDVRQVGGKRSEFAPGAVIVRVDIDKNELEYQIREDEIDIQTDVGNIIEYLEKNCKIEREKYTHWHEICTEIAEKLEGLDNKTYNAYVKRISSYVPEGTIITTDVGQNQVWVAQSYMVKSGQRILFSGGHGAMGYSLPAAIGAYFATYNPVVCFNGDGGIQMNIQELELVRREKIPVKIFVFNNYALGMIRHFQEMYFHGNYTQTVCGKGYSTPDFEKLAIAYDIRYICYENLDDVTDEFIKIPGPVFIEIKLKEDTYVFPKLEFEKANQDQEPLLDRALFNYLMNLK